MRMLGIIGTGLIGSSIGLAARARGWTVLGYDADASASKTARDVTAIDRPATRDEVYAECAIVVIAVPVRATIEEVSALRDRRLRGDQLVLDTASVKAAVAEAADGLRAFVPTHPMAGSERSGPLAARSDLFEDRTWCVVPTENEERTKRAIAFVEDLGAHAVPIGAAEHDRVVALTSHVPQLFAFAFARRIAERSSGGEAIEALCGPAGRELLRLGRSSAAMWEQIFAENAEAIGFELERLWRTMSQKA